MSTSATPSSERGPNRPNHEHPPVTEDLRATEHPTARQHAGFEERTHRLDEPGLRRTPGAAADEVKQRQEEAYGGIKFGSAFFGWLTATAAAVLLTALVTAAGAAVGVGTNTDAASAASSAAADAKTVGITGGIILLVILFIAYYCGGYVAGRMARFNGLRQGLAVWLWAVVVALLVAALAAVAGSKFDVLSKLNSFPRIPVNGDTLTTGGIIALVAVAVASLAGALLGGLAGMRFHRKVDRVALGS